jgi:hypothetical protein
MSRHLMIKLSYLTCWFISGQYLQHLTLPFSVSCVIISINCDDSCQIILQKSDIVFNNGPCVAIYVLQTELSDYLEIKIDK